ncbi:MFS transporter [Robbsia andropogonis]|uniref:MFS transporter n=1 Tax=Robbsia andropogonis TaxID=28092 RepID=A0A0F5K2L2_9BURK|nr:MFS transporter [Robbsia andropogonis]KKB64165.1 MFS transporter [Robbsia andropogonis]
MGSPNQTSGAEHAPGTAHSRETPEVSPSVHVSASQPGQDQHHAAVAASLLSARLDRLPATRTIWRFVVLLSLGFFFEMYDLLFTGYIAPGIVKSGILSATTPGLFGNNGVAGFIAALFSGLFIGTIACGFLADRFGRRAVFTGSLLWYSVANVVMAFQDTALGLNLWRFIAGIGIGVELVTIGTYIAELVPKQIRGRAFACEQAIGFVAVPCAAILTYLLSEVHFLGLEGWRWVVLIGAHGAMFIWWIRRQLPESPRWLALKGRTAEAERIVADLETRVASEYGKPLPPPLAPEPVGERKRFRDILQGVYRKRTTMLVLCNVFQTVGYFGFANWLPTLLISHGVTVTRSLAYSSIIAVAAPIGPMIGLWMGDRFERKSMIVFMAGAIMVCGLLFSQVTGSVPLIVTGVLITLACNMMSFNLHAYQTELYPTAIRAQAVGFVYSWSRFSAIFTAFAISAILHGFGVVGVFAFIAAAMLIVMLVIGLMGPRTRDIALEKISH